MPSTRLLRSTIEQPATGGLEHMRACRQIVWPPSTLLSHCLAIRAVSIRQASCAAISHTSHDLFCTPYACACHRCVCSWRLTIDAQDLKSLTVSPLLILPPRTASSNARGMEAADVLPYSSRFDTTRSEGMLKRCAAASRMRWLA